MVQYILEANREGCVGMAANMIGVKKRVIIVNMGLVDLVMFNPVLLKADMSAWAGSFGRNYYLNQRDSKKAILPVPIGLRFHRHILFHWWFYRFQSRACTCCAGWTPDANSADLGLQNNCRTCRFWKSVYGIITEMNYLWKIPDDWLLLYSVAAIKQE